MSLAIYIFNSNLKTNNFNIIKLKIKEQRKILSPDTVITILIF